MQQVKSDLAHSDRKIKQLREDTKKEIAEKESQIESKDEEIQKLREMIKDREFQMREAKIQKKMINDDYEAM